MRCGACSTGKSRPRESHAGVRTLGIDETACARGQHYITLAHDLDSRRLLFATPGRDAATLASAVEDLREHGGAPQAIETVCMDMSRAFIAGVQQNLPQAAVAFDRFHVIQMANAALDAVRREEVRTEPQLKRSRWARLKDARGWTHKQLQAMHQITHSRLKTARAWRLKESLRDIYRTGLTREQAQEALTRWTSWARRCRLEPFKKLANAFGDGQRHNAYVEAVISLLQAAKARARGYGTTKHFIAMAYLIAGKLKHLPPTPFAAPRHAT